MKGEFVKGLVEKKEERLKELKRELRLKLETLQEDLTHALQRGYDFGLPSLNLFAAILQLEAQIRELTNF